jgi:hypothetical protein
MTDGTNHQHTPAQTAELARRAAYGREHPGPLSDAEIKHRREWDRAAVAAPPAPGVAVVAPAPIRVGPKPTEVQQKHADAQIEETKRRAAYDIEHPDQPMTADEFSRRAAWDNRKLGAEPAGDLKYPLRPYVWTATPTIARDETIYRRAFAEDPHTVPIRVWQFCEENNVNVCAFDGVTARRLTETEEALALSPPAAHAQIRADGGVMHLGESGRTIRVDLPEDVSSPAPISVQHADAPTAGPLMYPPPSERADPLPAPSFPPSAAPPPAPQGQPWIAPVETPPHHDVPHIESSSGE